MGRVKLIVVITTENNGEGGHLQVENPRDMTLLPKKSNNF